MKKPMNIKPMIPEVSRMKLNLKDDMKVPEWYVEESLVSGLSDSMKESMSITYEEGVSNISTQVTGEVVIMSVEERSLLIGYLNFLESENESLQKILELISEKENV